MSKRFYKVVIHPVDNDEWYSDEGCPCPPNDGSCPDCNGCEYLKYIGTLGGEYYIDCDY